MNLGDLESRANEVAEEIDFFCNLLAVRNNPTQVDEDAALGGHP